MKQTQIAIIGGGLSGLSAARVCEKHKIDYILLEKEERLGGRQKTDIINGYTCDHGFHIMLTSYPEVKSQINLNALNPLFFPNGANIWNGTQFHHLHNPLSSPLSLFKLFKHPALSLPDIFKLGKLITYLLTHNSIESIPEMPTHTYFKSLNLSTSCIQKFLTPFFRGIFLDPNLTTSSRLFTYYLKQFCLGRAMLPTQGIGAIPTQIASHCNPKRLLTQQEVIAINGNQIHIKDQESIQADAILCTTDASTASTLSHIPNIPYHHTNCFYFSAPSPPIASPTLHLDGLSGPINNFYCPSLLSSSLSPKNTYLLSFTTLPTHNTIIHENEILAHAKQYFGHEVSTWSFITKYSIPKALPMQPQHYGHIRTSFNAPPLYFAGDWTIQGSIQGALYSGRRLAEDIIKRLG